MPNEAITTADSAHQRNSRSTSSTCRIRCAATRNNRTKSRKITSPANVSAGVKEMRVQYPNHAAASASALHSGRTSAVRRRQTPQQPGRQGNDLQHDQRQSDQQQRRRGRRPPAGVAVEDIAGLPRPRPPPRQTPSTRVGPPRAARPSTAALRRSPPPGRRRRPAAETDRGPALRFRTTATLPPTLKRKNVWIASRNAVAAVRSTETVSPGARVCCLGRSSRLGD